MYIPPHHRFDDRAAQLDLIDAHPLGTWVCLGTDGLTASHRAFVLDRARGDHGTLSARIDPDDAGARAVQAGAPSLVVFHGPQAYISPGWYPGKAEHGRVVPTWNYVVVHAHGAVRWTADSAGIEIAIQRLEGKLKASQDEARADREGTVVGLRAAGSEAARTMAALVQHALNTSPH
jgi:transcriptional regulator